MPEPFLRISDAAYFLWGSIFYGPVIVAAWLLSAGAVYLVSTSIHLKPAFDAVLRATAAAAGIGTLGTLVPDLITSPLRAAGVIEEQAWEISISTHGAWFFITWTTLMVYVLLFLVGYPLAVKLATAATWPRAILIGFAGFVVFQGFE
jgi:hypothetical protein